MLTLAEKCLVTLAQNNTAIDDVFEDFIRRHVLPNSTREGLDAICAYPQSPVGALAVSARARANWQRIAEAAMKQTPLSALRVQWTNNTSAGFTMLRTRYGGDFGAFARDYFAEV